MKRCDSVEYRKSSYFILCFYLSFFYPPSRFQAYLFVNGNVFFLLLFPWQSLLFAHNISFFSLLVISLFPDYLLPPHPVVSSFLQSPSLSFSFLNCFNRIFCRPLTHTSRNNPPKQPLRTISSMRSIFLLRSPCFASLTSYYVRTNWSASLMKYNRTIQFFSCSPFQSQGFLYQSSKYDMAFSEKKKITFSFSFFFSSSLVISQFYWFRTVYTIEDNANELRQISHRFKITFAWNDSTVSDFKLAYTSVTTI